MTSGETAGRVFAYFNSIAGPSLTHPDWGGKLHPKPMLRNFFKTAYRNIVKNKVYAIINFIGLTTGLALCLLIIVYVRSETGYDQFHTKIDRLYRINYEAPNGLWHLP